MSENQIISHLFCDDGGQWHIQSNAEHCNGVASLAESFASEFGMGSWGRMLGLLHDRGKERVGFQSYIRRNSGYDTSNSFRTDSEYHHAAIGAIIAHGLKLDMLFWLSNAIAGHHRGLYDCDELESVLDQGIPSEVSTDLPDIDLSLPQFTLDRQEAHHISRMLFSCLVDADWLDTERFMNSAKHSQRNARATMQDLKLKLDAHLSQLAKSPASEINLLRAEIQQECAKQASLAPGFFHLTVPTGGGKTIASIVWAVNHSLLYGKKRIIIAIPFTSIIVQTAQTLRNIFGENNVVEHHSALDEENITESNQLACENWDAPIIVTTNVQLLESMFSNRPSACRKLHSICNSVIIFDETQSLPLSFLQPIVDSMKSYARLFNASFLFCTASQPLLHGERKGSGLAVFKGFEEPEVRPIINDGMKLHCRLRRADMTINREPVDTPTLCNELGKHDRVLCIVNSRRHALEVFQGLPDDGIPAFHLSRMMCPAHLLDTINEIKRRLADPYAKLRVVSTQLIEAGVDIDFPVVYRQLSGLDSLLQAAGRCNREGKLPLGHTHVFQFAGEKPFGTMGFATSAMQSLMELHPDADWFAPETMAEFYRILYSKTPSFDANDINRLLKSPQNCLYEEASLKFKLIDENERAIIVNYGNSHELIKELRAAHKPSRSLSRRLGRYTVPVREHLFNKLLKAGMLEQPKEGFYTLALESQYHPVTGLKTDNEYIEQTIII